MKLSSHPHRTPSRLSDSLRRNLNMYGLAASAAGVSLLGLAQPSEARIVYTKTHQVIASNGIYALHLSHDGAIDFLVQERRAADLGNSEYSGLWVKEAFGNAVQGSNHLAAALSKGSPIGPQQGFISSKGSFGEVMIAVSCGIDSCSTRGQWLNAKNRYLGLKFRISGKTHFGWARLSVKVGKDIVTTLTGFAYETVANKGLDAGQTEDTTDNDTANLDVTGASASDTDAALMPTPPWVRPGSLGMLALGTSSVSVWRRP